MRHFVVFLAFLANPAVGAGQASATRHPQLLLPGAPPPDSVNAATWFGVYQSPAGYEVRRAVIRVVATPNACAAKSKVTAAQPNEPMLLIAGVAALREGSVDSAFTGYKFLRPGESLLMRLGSHEYRLVARGRVSRAQYTELYSGYELLLTPLSLTDSTSEMVVRLDFSLDNTPAVLWAGDLDHDRSLDLFLQLPGGGYSRDFHLFLSSLARPPARLRDVAHYYAADC